MDGRREEPKPLPHRSDSRGTPVVAWVRPGRPVSLGGLVSHAVRLEVAFHALFQSTTLHHLDTALNIAVLDPPSRRRGETRDNGRAVLQESHRLDRIDVVVRGTRPEHALQDPLRLEHVARGNNEPGRGFEFAEHGRYQF